MQLGIFAKTFARDTLEANLDAVQSFGFECVQYNLSCAGLSTLPTNVPTELIERIRSAFAQQRLTMAAISGTFNIIHPDVEQREAGFEALRVLLSVCHDLGTDVVTMCTGTRDPDSMWKRHPENDSPEAWRDCVDAMKRATRLAEEFDVVVGIEPEVNNVVDSAVKARRLLDEIGSPKLGIIFDGANLFHEGELPRMSDILSEAVALLGKDTVLAHAKDLDHDGDAGNIAAGTGLLDYDLYLRLLREAGFDGALIAHGLSEDQAAETASFLRQKLNG